MPETSGIRCFIHMKILYIASASVFEPLIESQVLCYLRHLASKGCSFDLLTFERREISPEEQDALRKRLGEFSVNWIPHWIVQGKRSAGIFRDIRDASKELERHLKKHPCDLIHARSFLPGNIAIRLKKRLGIPVLYDMRGFWAKEKFAYGRISLLPGKWVAQFMEDRVFKNADYLVSLTHAGIDYLKRRGLKKPIRCIPCCVDLEHFVPAEKNRGELSGPVQLISVGSLGRGYRCDAVFGVAQELMKIRPGTTLLLLTRTDPEVIHATAKSVGMPASSYAIKSVPHEQVAAEIAASGAGICMVAPSESKVASCPTKLGEYLACGIPSIANIPIGDVEETLAHHNTGVSVRLDVDDFKEVAMKFDALLQDSGVRQRARQTAEEMFCSEAGAASYFEIYQQMTCKNND